MDDLLGLAVPVVRVPQLGRDPDVLAGDSGGGGDALAGLILVACGDGEARSAFTTCTKGLFCASRYIQAASMWS